MDNSGFLQGRAVDVALWTPPMTAPQSESGATTAPDVPK
jgi:hypothetical protein